MGSDSVSAHQSWPVRAYLWACDRLYGELAGVYDYISWLVSLGGWDGWRRLALADAHGNVLELGCGTGALLAAMASTGRAVVGLELSPAMQHVAAQRFARGGVHPAQVRARAEQMPLATGSFDTVIATFPAPYILAPATLGECRRVLRPGGSLVVVGLWVQAPRLSLLQFAPFFYGAPSAQQIARVTDHVAQAGFHARLTWRVTPRGEVAVVIATLSAVQP